MLNRVASGTEPRKYTGKGQQTSRDRQGQRALENRRSLEADRQLREGQAGEQGTGPVDRVKLKKMGSRLSGRRKTGVGGDGGRGAAGFPSVTRCHGGPVTLRDDRPLAGLPPPANCTPLEDWDVPRAVCPGDQHSAGRGLGGSMELSGEGGCDLHWDTQKALCSAVGLGGWPYSHCRKETHLMIRSPQPRSESAELCDHDKTLS